MCRFFPGEDDGRVLSGFLYPRSEAFLIFAVGGELEARLPGPWFCFALDWFVGWSVGLFVCLLVGCRFVGLFECLNGCLLSCFVLFCFVLFCWCCSVCLLLFLPFFSVCLLVRLSVCLVVSLFLLAAARPTPWRRSNSPPRRRAAGAACWGRCWRGWRGRKWPASDKTLPEKCGDLVGRAFLEALNSLPEFLGLILVGKTVLW